MAQGYLRRNDVGYPARPNPRGIYAVKHLENEDPEVLETSINAYLLQLPQDTQQWSPHIVSTLFMAVPSVSGLPVIIHHCWITIFAAGTIVASPT